MLICIKLYFLGLIDSSASVSQNGTSISVRGNKIMRTLPIMENSDSVTTNLLSNIRSSLKGNSYKPSFFMNSYNKQIVDESIVKYNYRLELVLNDIPDEHVQVDNNKIIFFHHYNISISRISMMTSPHN